MLIYSIMWGAETGKGSAPRIHESLLVSSVQSALCYMLLNGSCLLNNYYVLGIMLGAGGKSMTQTDH